MKSMHLAFALLSSFLLLAVLAGWHIYMQLLPVGVTALDDNGNHAEKEIVIPLNYSTSAIAGLLEEQGIIQSALIFRLYARYHGYDQQLQAGRYILNPAMGMADILQDLKQGVVFKETRRFTIPEGFTLEQIAERLDATGLVTADLFMEAGRQYHHADFAFLEEIPADGVYHRLEGYLFPDTYEVFPDATAEDIITMMLQRFAGVFNESYRSRAKELGLTIHEVITLASLVEREGRVRDEKPLISAVFHNRLKQYMLLQSCATVQYALGETRAFLTYADLEIDSPYNTYIHPGLPPGPIASPGLYALRATLNPAPVDYLFFVSREDGSGAHFFSRTLQEHNRYREIARRNRN